MRLTSAKVFGCGHGLLLWFQSDGASRECAQTRGFAWGVSCVGFVAARVMPSSQAARPGRPSPPGPLWAAPGRHGPPQAVRFSLALDPGRAGPSGAAKAGPGGTERGQARRRWAGLGRLGAAGAKRGCGLVGRGQELGQAKRGWAAPDGQPGPWR